MTTNLNVYCCSNDLVVGATTDLHSNLGWSKINKNFGSVLRVFRRDHQGGMMGMGGNYGTPVAAAATVTVSSSDAGLDPYLGGS